MAQFLADRVHRLAKLSSHAESAATVDSYDAQDIVSCLYHILQLHGSFLATQCGSEGPAAIIQCGDAMLSALNVIPPFLEGAVHCKCSVKLRLLRHKESL